MTRITIGTTIVLVFAALVFAQAGLTGRWQGETPNGDPIVLDVKANDTTVSGTINIDGQPMAISDGKVARNTVTFKVAIGGGRTEAFTGELAGDRLTIWIDRQGRDRSAAVLTRLRS